MRKQNTIKQNMSFSGTGIHSGRKSTIVLKPAPEDTGIVFVHKSGQGNQFIPYSSEYVTDTQNNISVSNGKAVVKTVEHLAAALYAAHIDNCLIECSSSEIPIMDGSAYEFIQSIISAEKTQQVKSREEFRIISPIWVTLEDKFIVALPYNGLKFSYTISFPNTPVGTQTFQTEFNTEIFVRELSHARTFGFIEDLEKYQQKGMSLGVHIGNVHAFSKAENRAINTPRYEEEPVRHKILDLIGSFGMLNLDIKGFIISYKGGHTLDVLFVKKVMNILSGNFNYRNYAEKPEPGYYYHMAGLFDMNKNPS